MSKTSQFKRADEACIGKEHMRELCTCIFCGKESYKGGSWAGSIHFGVCSACHPYLIHLLIDTLEDDIFQRFDYSLEEKHEYISDKVLKILEKKLKVE